MTHAENQGLVNLSHKLQNLVNKAKACILSTEGHDDVVAILQKDIRQWQNTLTRIRTRMATEPVTIN